MHRTRICALVATAWLCACAGRGQEAEPTDELANIPPDATPRPATEAEIVDAALTIDDGDLALAKLGQARLSADDLQRFSAILVERHQADRAAIVALPVAPSSGPTSRALRDDLASMHALAQAKGSTEFDASWLAIELAVQRRILARVDSVLLPSARSPDVQRAIRALREEIARELDSAGELEALRTTY